MKNYFKQGNHTFIKPTKIQLVVAVEKAQIKRTL